MMVTALAHRFVVVAALTAILGLTACEKVLYQAERYEVAHSALNGDSVRVVLEPLGTRKTDTSSVMESPYLLLVSLQRMPQDSARLVLDSVEMRSAVDSVVRVIARDRAFERVSTDSVRWFAGVHDVSLSYRDVIITLHLSMQADSGRVTYRLELPMMRKLESAWRSPIAESLLRG